MTFAGFSMAPEHRPKVVPYDFNDVVRALNTVMPYDWRGFWTLRLTEYRRMHRSRDSRPRLAPDLLPNRGWRRKPMRARKTTNLYYSLG